MDRKLLIRYLGDMDPSTWNISLEIAIIVTTSKYKWEKSFATLLWFSGFQHCIFGGGVYYLIAC